MLKKTHLNTMNFYEICFITYCFTAGIGLSKLTKNMSFLARNIWFFIILTLHIYLAFLIEKL